MELFKKSIKREKELLTENSMTIAALLAGFEKAAKEVGFDVIHKQEDALKAVVMLHGIFIEMVEKEIDKKLSRDAKIYLMVSALGEFLKPFNKGLNDDMLKHLMTAIFDKSIKLNI